MKFNSTSFLREFFFSAIISLFFIQVTAQSTGINYTISQPAGALAYNSSSAGQVDLLTVPGTDDQWATFNATSVVGWGGFYYGGVWYPQATTTFWVSSNGWVAIQNFANPLDIPPPNTLPTNDLAGSSDCIIAPLWDDLRLHPVSGGRVTYKNTGGATTRVLVIEWKGMCWDKTSPDSAISFQVRIYNNANTAAPNAIEFRYKRNGLATQYLVSPSASIGLGGFCTNDVYAWTNLSATCSKNVPEAQNLASKPADPGSYRFTPVAHPNNECSAPQTITFDPSLPVNSVYGTTLHSTESAVPLPSCGGITTTSDVWFTFTKPANITNFEVYTDIADCRAPYYPGIEVFDACGGAVLGCDRGSAGPTGINATSYLNFTAQQCAAKTYWVRVFSPDTSSRGYFRMNVRPPGRNCAYANDITGCGLNYSSASSLSTCGFGNDYDSLYSACHSRVQHGEDYVFKYTPSINQCVNFALNNTPANSNPGLFIYANGCPSPITGPSGSEVCYGNIATAGGSPLQFNNVSLTAGQTYYFVIDFDSSGAISCLDNFDLNITSLGASPPTNDVCGLAQSVPITISSACVGSFDYNNNCATPSGAGTVPLPGCANFTDGITPDVWFSFTSNAVVTGPYQTNVDPGTIPAAQDLAMAIYSGGCGGLVPVPGACDDNSNGLMPSLSFTPLPSTTYYMRIWSNNGTKPGNFRICVLSGCTPPNDQCTGVITLQNGQPFLGDNGCSTGITEPSAGIGASCWVNSGGAGQLHTVWYNFVATNAQMRIRLRLLTMFDSQMALYSSTTGTCAGVFTQIFCNDNGPNNCGSGGTIRWSEITATGLTIGNTYFLRVDGTNANTGTFELTIVEGSNPFPPINTQDCGLAQSVCSGSSMTVADPGFQGTGNICDMANGGSTCMAAGERGASWYTWSVNGGVAGQYMNFLITPNSPNDYDFILYCVDTFNTATGGDGIPAIANYCSQLTNSGAFPALACNWSACGNTGCNQSAGTLNIPGGIYNGGAGAPCIIPAIFVPPGMTATFLLQASNYTTSTSGFTLNFQGTPINATPPNMIWTGAAGTTTWGTVTNWNPSNCGNVPSCANLIPAFVGTGAYQPTIVANTNVKDLTINPGANLTIAAGITLQICGNFTNNGTLTCGTGANITFIGNAAQTVNGTFAAASNQFYNLVVNKSAGTTLTFNTNIFCQGNLTVTTGILNVNNKNIEIGGNFYNVNGPTSMIGLGSGPAGSTITFTRRSTVNQLFQNDGAPLTLNNVSMRQLLTGGTLTLNANATSDMIIGTSGVLSLGTGVGVGQHGVIITPSTREVNVLNSAATACNAGSTSSYVSGRLRRAIATAANSYDFPVGDLAKGYELANINYTTAPASTYNLLAQFKIWGVGTNCPFPGTNGPTASECVLATYDMLPYFNHGYWNIDASVASPTGTYRITAYNTAMTNNTGLGWTVVKATSGSCSFALSGLCWSGSTAAATRRDNLTGFSDFATVQSQTPLPVELRFFDATLNNMGVLCSWVTATEINNDHFDIERSKDGSKFNKIGEMKGYGAGTSVHNLEYKYQDEEICTGTVYYRLKQVDIDGKYSYSDIVAVVCKSGLVNIAPNPAYNEVNLSFYEPLAGNVTIHITDIIGQDLVVKTYSVEKGYNESPIDISSLASGVYYLKITNADSHAEEVARQIKFVKY